MEHKHKESLVLNYLSMVKELQNRYQVTFDYNHSLWLQWLKNSRTPHNGTCFSPAAINRMMFNTSSASQFDNVSLLEVMRLLKALFSDPDACVCAITTKHLIPSLIEANDLNIRWRTKVTCQGLKVLDNWNQARELPKEAGTVYLDDVCFNLQYL